jgi:gliding-associated putative ABC transporter substrate-binding component GldG
MKTAKKTNIVLFVLALISALVLLNLLSLRFFMRTDLTRDKKYTLSQASKETVAELKDLMTVSAYFSEGLPPPYAQHARYVNDLLVEYLAAAKGNFAFEFSDPTSSETSEDKAKKKESKRDIFGRLVREPTSVEQELAQLGLQPVEIRVIEDDQQQTKRAYMGIVIRYQEKHEVIPVVQNLSDLEKDMTGLMRKLVRERMPKVGLIRDPQGPSIQKVIQALSQNVTIVPLDLREGEIEADMDALLVVGSGDHFGEQGAVKIQQFLDRGKSAAFLLDRVNVDPRSFQYQLVGPRSSTHLIFDWLKSYGVDIESNLVADAACASFNVQENRGGFAFTLPIKYPFVPELMNLSFESPITKGLSGVIIPFAAKVNLSEHENIKAQILAQSSKVSWLEKEPFDLNPRRDWNDVDIVPDGPHTLMVQLRGYSKEPLKQEEKENIEEKKDEKKEEKREFRMVVAGSSAFLWDDFLAGANQLLALNIVDWMLADAALLEMRSRTFSDAPLNTNLSDGVKQAVKYGNILGVPALLIIYGLIRWRMRESRRHSLKIN